MSSDRFMMIHSNHEDDVDQQRRLYEVKATKDRNQLYPLTRIKGTAPPPQLSTDMYRRSTSNGSDSSGGGQRGGRQNRCGVSVSPFQGGVGGRRSGNHHSDNYGPPSIAGGSSTRLRMTRMGRAGGGDGYPSSNSDDHDPTYDHGLERYVSSDQSVNSHMTESVISNPRMSRMDEEELELQRTQQSRGGGALRSRSPPSPHKSPDDYRRYTPSDGRSSRNFQYDDNNYAADDPRGGRGGQPRERDDPPPPRHMMMMMQRVPSQSTISTSGFRSFYSDVHTVRGCGDSVSIGYQHHYDGPPPSPPPPTRDDYHSSPSQRYRSGGASVGDPGRVPYAGVGYGGDGGGGGVGPRGPTDFAPRRQPTQPPPPPPPAQRRPSSQPDRPLLEVAPGLLMHLMGTEETMKAIQRGQMTVTSCVVCGMDVHCHSSSEYVLCPDCRVVSPVNQLDNTGDMTPQQGGLVGLGVRTEMLITMMEAGGQQY